MKTRLKTRFKAQKNTRLTTRIKVTPKVELTSPNKSLYNKPELMNHEFETAQLSQATALIDGVQCRRVLYGKESYDCGADHKRCHDCGVIKGYVHLFWCDVEDCPACGEQLFSCDCHAFIGKVPKHNWETTCGLLGFTVVGDGTAVIVTTG